jgi:hypothetical protein
MLNKKAQIGESTTWIVATIIIIVMLLVFFYASNALAIKSLSVKIKQLKIFTGFAEDSNLLVVKSSIAYLRTPGGVKRDAVENWLDNQDIDVEDYVNK